MRFFSKNSCTSSSFRDRGAKNIASDRRGAILPGPQFRISSTCNLPTRRPVHTAANSFTWRPAESNMAARPGRPANVFQLPDSSQQPATGPSVAGGKLAGVARRDGSRERIREDRWVRLFEQLGEILISILGNVAQVSPAKIRQIADGEELRQALGWMWREACSIQIKESLGERLRAPFAATIVADSVAESSTSQSHWRAAAIEGRTQNDASALGARAKMRRVSAGEGDNRQIRRFA